MNKTIATAASAATAALFIVVAPMSAQALAPADISLWAISTAAPGILYSIDASDGTATAVGRGTGIASAVAGALDPTSDTLYVINRACQLYSVDTANGTATSTGHTLGGAIAGQPIYSCDSMTIAADGSGYVNVQTAVNYDSYFATFDLASGVTTPVGPKMNAYYDWMAIDPATGVLYGQNDNSGDLYSMDTTSGVETRISTFAPYSYNMIIAGDGTFYSNTWSDLAYGTFSARTGSTVGTYSGPLGVDGTNALFTTTNVFLNVDPSLYESRASLAKTGTDATSTLLLGGAGLVTLLIGAAALVISRRRQTVTSR